MQWENVYIFISSTFNDMHAERDYLVKKVFPRLSAWCEERRLRLIDIDLRWGVSEADATENKRVVQVCLDRIDACRPFFLCFLGQRRGWVPGEGDISDETYRDFPELLEKHYSGNASVTEMEILHALIDPLHNGMIERANGERQPAGPVEHAFFFLREPGYLESVKHESLLDIYTNRAEQNPREADAQLARWRQEIIPGTGRPVYGYTGEWDETQRTHEISLPLYCPTTAPVGSDAWGAAFEKWARMWGAVGVNVSQNGEIADAAEREKAEAYNKRLTQGRLSRFASGGQELADVIIENLKTAIVAQFGQRAQAEQTPLQNDLDQQAQFLRMASDGYIRRADDFAKLDAYIKGDDNRPFAVTAAAGMGKTSFLAHYINGYSPDTSVNETIHYRFIGASDDSGSIERLIYSLIKELEAVGKVGKEKPTNRVQAIEKFPAALDEAGQKGKTIIMIDALNQLETGLEYLSWIPLKLPDHIKLVISYKQGDAEEPGFLKNARAERLMAFHAIEPFTGHSDRIKLVNAYLSQYFKELDDSRVDALVSTGGAENPLFLKTVLSELRVFGSFQNLDEVIRRSFGDTPLTAFDALLARMEGDSSYTGVPNDVLIPHMFGWLAHAKNGLSVNEIAGLFSFCGLAADPEEVASDILVILRQLRPYLAYRDGRTDFFYESFLIAARQRYTAGHKNSKPSTQWHQDLADYFEGKPLTDRHKLMEQAYQYAAAGNGDALKKLLCDYEFMDARLGQFDAEALLDDYRRAEMPEAGMHAQDLETLQMIGKCVQLSADTLLFDKSQLGAQLWGRMAGIEREEIKRLLQQVRECKRETWLRPTVKCLDGPGGSAARVWKTTGLMGDGVTANWPKEVAAVSSDGNNIQVFDLAEERQTKNITLGKIGGVIRAIQMSNDARQLAVAVTGRRADGRCIMVLDLFSGECLHSIPLSAGAEEQGMLSDMKATPDLDRILVSYDTNEKHATVEKRQNRIDCFEFDGQAYREVWALTLPGSVRCIHLSGDGRLAAFGYFASTSDTRKKLNSVEVWNIDENRQLLSHDLEESVNGVALHSDNDTLVFAEFDALTALCLSRYPADVKSVRVETTYAMTLSGDGKTAVLGRRDGVIELWRIPEMQLIQSFQGHAKHIRPAPACTPCADRILSTSGDGTIKLWRPALNGGREDAGDFSLRTYTQEGVSATFCGGRPPLMAACFPSGTPLAICDLERKHVTILKKGNHDLRDADLSVGGKRAVTVQYSVKKDENDAFIHSNWINCWDTETAQCTSTLPKQDGKHAAVAFTPDENILFAGYKDGRILVWDVAAGTVLRELREHSAELWRMIPSPDAKTIVSIDKKAGDDSLAQGPNRIIFWDAVRFAKKFELDTKELETKNAAFSPDGQYFITSDGSHKGAEIHIWDTSDGSLVQTINGHTNWSHAVALSGDSRYVFTDRSAISNSSISLWDMADCRPVSRFFSSGVEYHSFVALDGQRLAALDRSGRIDYFQLENGERLEVAKEREESFLAFVIANTPAESNKAFRRLIKQARAWYDQKQYDQAKPVYEEALRYTRYAAAADIGHVRVMLGLCCYNMRDMDEAVSFFEAAMENYRQSDITPEQKGNTAAIILKNIGLCYHASDRNKAEEYYRRAEAAKERKKEDSPPA